jgi:hypothetical protein
MSTVSVVATKVRIATAATAIAAAATLAPAAVAYASPAAPLPMAGLGSTAGVVTVAPCNPDLLSCSFVAAGIGDSSIAGSFQNSLIWIGSPANPNYQPIFGITFPNFFGLDFEACFLGAGIHMSSYTGTGFIGLSAGC